MTRVEHKLEIASEATLKAAVKANKSILLLGPPGSGKSTLAEKLGAKLTKDGKAVSLLRVYPERGAPPEGIALIDKPSDAIGNNSDYLIIDDLDYRLSEYVQNMMRVYRIRVIATVQSNPMPFFDYRDRLMKRQINQNILDNFHIVSDVDWRSANKKAA